MAAVLLWIICPQMVARAASSLNPRQRLGMILLAALALRLLILGMTSQLG